MRSVMVVCRIDGMEISDVVAVVIAEVVFFFKQKTAYEI